MALTGRERGRFGVLTKGPHRRARTAGGTPAVGLLLLLLAAGTALAGSCPVDLFREYDPGRPPGILTAPPVTQVQTSPWTDPDPTPFGTVLTWYRLNLQTADPDPSVPVIFVEKEGTAARIVWVGGNDPAACCTGTDCADLCPGECEARGGTWLGAGASCADDPPPCATSTACVSTGPFFGMSKVSGGGTVFGGSGYPTLAPVTLQQVDPMTGASTSQGLELIPEEQRVWNFTGARDARGHRYYYAGGRWSDSDFPPTIVTVDTATPALVSAVPIPPQVDFARLAFDPASGNLYGLVLEDGGINLTGGHHYFPALMDLAIVDPTDGTVTTVVAGLPGQLDHFAATLDSRGGRYIYHTFAGELHSVDLVTGAVTTVSVPDHLAALEWDEATRTLYALRTCCATNFQASGVTGYRMFGDMELVKVDDVTGAVTLLSSSPLPAGTTNWITAYDCEHGLFLYVSDTGETQVVDVGSGDLVSTSPPPTDARLYSLD